MSESFFHRRHEAAAGAKTLSLLFFGLLGGPAAWALHLFANYSLSSRRCFPNAETHIASTPLSLDYRLIMFGVDVIALIVVSLALLASFSVWREATGGARFLNESHTVVDRSRFLSVWGMSCEGLFLLALIFDLLALGILPRCG